MTLGVLASLLICSGCASAGRARQVLTNFRGRTGQQKQIAGKKSRFLPSIQKPRDAMQFDIVFAERHKDDPLLRNALWSEIDQVSAVAPEIRAALTRNGLRIGHTSSTPPRAVETLLGLSSDPITNVSMTTESSRLVGRKVVLRPGAHTQIQTSDICEECTVSFVAGDEPDVRDFKHARFVLRMTAYRLQDGWAKVEFLPEIHHGAQRWRPIATEGGWIGRTSQNIERLYDQRFTIELNVGEMAVITADADSPDSLGSRFFIGGGGSDHDDMQRVLVVRLSDMSNNDALFSD